MRRVEFRPISDFVEPVATWNPLRDDPDDTFQYIDLSAIDQEKKQITAAREVSNREAPSRARQIVNAGDILVSTVRPNLNGVANVPAELDAATASTGFCVLRPNSQKLISSYLFHWVKSPQFVSDMVRKATGASYPAVSDKIVVSSLIPYLAPDEQRHIAAILNQADALRAKRREALAQLDHLTQSIFMEMFGDTNTANSCANTVQLSEVTTRITDGTHLTPKFIDSGVPFIFVKNFQNGCIDFETDKFISEEEYKSLYKRCPVEKEDILYTTVGATYGQAVAVGNFTKFAFQRHVAHLKPDRSKIIPKYLEVVMQLPLVKLQADRWARGAAQPTVNLTELRQFLIPLPIDISLNHDNR